MNQLISGTICKPTRLYHENKTLRNIKNRKMVQRKRYIVTRSHATKSQEIRLNNKTNEVLFTLGLVRVHFRQNLKC